MATSREVVRDALVTLLTTEMVGVGLARTCTSNKMDIEGQDPLIYVASTGTLRSRETLDYDFPTYGFDIMIYVRQSYTGWTDAEACDLLDTLEAKLAETIETYRVSTDWILIGYTGPSMVEEVSPQTAGTGGTRYYKETIPLMIKLGVS